MHIRKTDMAVSCLTIDFLFFVINRKLLINNTTASSSVTNYLYVYFSIQVHHARMTIPGSKGMTVIGGTVMCVAVATMMIGPVHLDVPLHPIAMHLGA